MVYSSKIEYSFQYLSLSWSSLKGGNNDDNGNNSWHLGNDTLCHVPYLLHHMDVWFFSSLLPCHPDSRYLHSIYKDTEA